jgi:hypothetical protein
MTVPVRTEEADMQAILIVGGMLSVLVMAAGWALMRGAHRLEELDHSQLEAYRKYKALWDEQDDAIGGKG